MESSTKKVTLTEKETKVIHGMARCSNDFNGTDDPGGTIWTCEVASYSGIAPASLGGIFASLMEKGLIWSSGDEGSGTNKHLGPGADERTCCLTAEGVAALTS